MYALHLRLPIFRLGATDAQAQKHGTSLHRSSGQHENCDRNRLQRHERGAASGGKIIGPNNYAVAITGVSDTYGETVPVSLTASPQPGAIVAPPTPMEFKIRRIPSRL